jgi:aminopeptidase YwaD
MTSLRYRPHAWLAGLGAALLASSLLAAPPRAEEVSNPAITGPEIVAHIRYLASEDLQGRGSGDRGADVAAEYLAERFRAAGLKPAGDNGTFFQQFPVFTGIRLGEGNTVSLRSGKTSLALKTAAPPASEAAPDARGERAPLPGASSPAGDGDFMPVSFSKNGSVYAPLVFAGYGISKPDLGHDDYKGVDVRGKIVLVLRHTPDMDDQGKFAPFATLLYKTITARQKGAAGILFLTGPLGDHPEDFSRFALDSASSDAGIPTGIIKRRPVETLLEPTGKTLRDLQIMIAHGTTHSFPIPGARAGMKIHVVRDTAPTRNVIGLLEGSDPKLRDEVVVVGAHYDHLGLGNSHSLSASAKPEIHHGADDNASGTAGVLELAQYFAANREKAGRSLLFMGFSGEEIGLLGSAYWTKKPTIPVERIAAMINLDMIGRMRNDTVYVIGADSSPAWKELLEQANAPHRLQMKTGGSGVGIGLGASDQNSFYVKNIPVLFFFTGSHADYHRPSDTWEKIEAEGEAKLLHAVADTVERISRLGDRPQFTKSKEQTPTTGGSFPVYLGTIPDYSAEVEGVALQGVREGGPAHKGGMREGDVIVEFDGKKIRSVQEYTQVLNGTRPNVAVKVTVLRKGERVTLTVTPAARR